jgi:ribA/ribD-fused uncharacterized protein
MYAQEEIGPTTISRFSGRYGFLSNFYPCTVIYAGMSWKSSEHAYQAMKSESHTVHQQICDLQSASAAKQYGKKIKLRADWTDDLAIKFMTEIVGAKFTQNTHLKAWLINTGEVVLEEGNTWNDTFWGVCPPGPNGKGRNELGKILMAVRSKLAQDGPTPARP